MYFIWDFEENAAYRIRVTGGWSTFLVAEAFAAPAENHQTNGAAKFQVPP